ncbi:MAG: exodeoxyribonuclease V [Candidatus Viridilinea halotolerans]|uniref:Exodeoxyribonuclease V n=1 Tax=Candidatus Viridilinea halotolerans TaxID=2491704 RepID=A0A426U0I1_9CHLR|nr:MAG: exodeoxyribonuclease V [Candidatus Viridilinea halotolerans]
MIHLSVRLSWHDAGWDGRVCRHPHLNASCIANEQIRTNRNDDLERKYAGQLIDELKGYQPPCSRDITTFAPCSTFFTHNDPLNRGFLKSITEQIPAYSCMPAPYRWMREENFRQICELEGLKIRDRTNPHKERGWVYEPDRQTALLSSFWGKIKDGEGHALAFFYVNQGNPVDENALRLLVGVGRIKQVSPQLFFDGTDKEGVRYPIWTRYVTHDFPAQGFRLPYQEYIDRELDPIKIACYVPANAFLDFSYIGEHVSDDVAVGVLEQLIQSVRVVQAHGQIAGDWDRHLIWLNDCLDEVWRNRGPFPGIGSVLQYLGCSQGAAFQRLELANCVRTGENPWTKTLAILEGRASPPKAYAAAFQTAAQRWRTLKANPARIALLETLARFELTTEQARRVCSPDERVEAGLPAEEQDLVANPYLICELDRGTAASAPVALEAIDHGMRPEGDAALFIPNDQLVAPDDASRVRAVAVTTLREAGYAGDTLLTFAELLERIRDRFPAQRACRPDRDVVIAEAEFHRTHLWMALDTNPQLVGLNTIRKLEDEVAQTIRQRAPRKNQIPNPAPDWRKALTDRFGQPQDARELAALNEKEQALRTLFDRRVSVLTGSAGTGKTSTLKVFLNELERVKGKAGVYLLAPTGKARVRLSTETKRNAFTIHQFLFKQHWIYPEVLQFKEHGGDRAAVPTVIIDECSMVPIDMLGTLFRALKLDMIERLILVGDPNQLPPIGPGRPFVDIVTWLRANHVGCIATLRTTMRTADDGDAHSRALAFAESYRSDSSSPADDELLAELAQGQSCGDLAVYFWENYDELRSLIAAQLAQRLGIADGDYKAFNHSLGIETKPKDQPHWRQAEHWQILSPLRGQPFGTDELNRIIQRGYKVGLITRALHRYSKSPRPFGDAQIVWTDKVIQMRNQHKPAWPKSSSHLNYIANGEIGVVVDTWKSQDNGDSLIVGFATQEGVTYRYYRNEIDGTMELGYALTVHKAQGSDFDIVFLIIPQNAQTLSRELIYTGLTRFRKQLVLLIERDVSVLERLRHPKWSNTQGRNTQMFQLALRPDYERKLFYQDSLIHRTRNGAAVRSKSEVIVADLLDGLGLTEWEYEQRLTNPSDSRDFRLPDFTIGFQGDLVYWEHLGMLNLPVYREGWERKRRWYEQTMGIPVVGPGAAEDLQVEPGTFPVVITSRDGDDGSIDAQEIERLARRYILLEI